MQDAVKCAEERMTFFIKCQVSLFLENVFDKYMCDTAFFQLFFDPQY